MKTFVITELRENEKGEQFEVKTKIETRSLAGLIQYLKSNPRTLWNGHGWIEEDRQRRGRFDIRTREKKQIYTPIFDGEEVD